MPNSESVQAILLVLESAVIEKDWINALIECRRAYNELLVISTKGEE